MKVKFCIANFYMNYDFICDSRKEDNNGYLYGCIKISFNCGGDVGDVGMAMSLDGRTFITERMTLVMSPHGHILTVYSS